VLELHQLRGKLLMVTAKLVDVECHAGYRGEETPRRFRLGEGQVEIAEVVDRWLAPDHCVFRPS
jgi:hypothetical protein